MPDRVRRIPNQNRFTARNAAKVNVAHLNPLSYGLFSKTIRASGQLKGYEKSRGDGVRLRSNPISDNPASCRTRFDFICTASRRRRGSRSRGLARAVGGAVVSAVFAI